MNKHKQLVLLSSLRIAFGLLIIVALVAQLLTNIQQGLSVVNFFSFFTVESNILAAAVLLTVGVGALASKKATPQFAFIRGAATLYMTITGIVFALLLSGLQAELQLTVPWINVVLHYIGPVVILVDWLLFPPKFRFTFRVALGWLVFPVAYLVYSLVRGSFVQWYPYPFINPIENGWPTVIMMSVVIAVGSAGLAWLLSLRTRTNNLG